MLMLGLNVKTITIFGGDKNKVFVVGVTPKKCKIEKRVMNNTLKSMTKKIIKEANTKLPYMVNTDSDYVKAQVIETKTDFVITKTFKHHLSSKRMKKFMKFENNLKNEKDFYKEFTCDESRWLLNFGVTMKELHISEDKKYSYNLSVKSTDCDKFKKTKN